MSPQQAASAASRMTAMSATLKPDGAWRAPLRIIDSLSFRMSAVTWSGFTLESLSKSKAQDVVSSPGTATELVTGQRGFQAESEFTATGFAHVGELSTRSSAGADDFSLLEMVRNVEIRPPSLLNQTLPAELERIIYKALTKDRDQRYQTCADMSSIGKKRRPASTASARSPPLTDPAVDQQALLWAQRFAARPRVSLQAFLVSANTNTDRPIAVMTPHHHRSIGAV